MIVKITMQKTLFHTIYAAKIKNHILLITKDARKIEILKTFQFSTNHFLRLNWGAVIKGNVFDLFYTLGKNY